jgi:hypothetical protein
MHQNLPRLIAKLHTFNGTNINASIAKSVVRLQTKSIVKLNLNPLAIPLASVPKEP